MTVDYKWLLIGVAVGYFVLPRVQSAISGHRPHHRAAPAATV